MRPPMAVFADGKIEAYVGPPGSDAADDLEAVIVDFIAVQDALHHMSHVN